MRIIKIFFPILAVALFYSCFSDRKWDNPYDPESNIEFIKPEITSIQTIDFNKVEINWLKKDTLYTIVKLERATTNNTGAFTAIKEWQANVGTGVDSGVVFGQEYFYRILGLADEVEGEYSEIASATVNIPPPTNLSAEVLNDQTVKLTWDEPGATQAGRGQTSGPQGKKRIGIEKKHKSQGPIAGEDLESGILKRNGVAEETTIDKLNKKGPAGKGSAKQEIPDIPAYEQKPGGTSNAQRGLGRGFSGESFIDGYIIERAKGNGSFSVIDSVSNTGVYNDTGLLYGQTYKYRVCAYADQYKSDYVTVDSVATTFPTPSNLTATATSDQSIALSWSDNCGFEDGYELWRKTGSGSFEIIDSTSANGTAYADSGLTYGETYTYKIRAFTSLNVSDYSGEESTVMSIPAPSGLTILQGDDTAILNWTDNSSFETGFSIEKSVEAAPFAEIGTVAGNTVNYTDTDVNAISQYRYRVRAFTENNYSDYSEEAEFSLFTGDIYYISPTGSDFTGNGSANYPYKTIQKGIDVAGDSSLILVANGTYNESIDYSGKELTVASYYWLDIDTSHISATTISAVEGRVVNIDANDSELLGFTVTSGAASQGSGIYASDSVTIANCIITGNGYTGSGTGAGIYCADNSEVTISTCTITGNSITGNGSEGAGVYCGSSSTVNFTDCTITGNVLTGDGSHGAGIYAKASSALTLSNCDVNENAIVGESAAGAGVYSVGATLEVSGCDISGNTVTAEFLSGGSNFMTVIFTNCGQTGREGPTQSDCNIEYSGTALEGQVTVSSGIQEWTVPYTGIYTIEVWGAQGANSDCCNYYEGGTGARMKGNIELEGEQVIKVLVGQRGISDDAGGGGGGTFVVSSDNEPLIIAGGGSGANNNAPANPGVESENGTDGDNCSGTGGTNGNGGGYSDNCGQGSGAGGGFYSNGEGEGHAYGNSFGYGFLNGGYGGVRSEGVCDGGFGGGAGSHPNNTGSGAGGGYSGGGSPNHGSSSAGGGGGSYNAGTNQDNESGVNTGHGQVVITSPHSATQGVGIYSSADLTIDNSTINNNEIIIPGSRGGPYGGGVYATGSLTMTDSETSNNGADGVYCTSSGASYTDITATGNGSYGIYSGGSASFTNITANTNGASGLYDEDGTSIFDNCTANTNAGDGIYTAGDGTFSNCTANNNASGRGIWCDGAGSFTTCETNNNFSDGIYASDGSDFTGCDAGGNGGDGLYAGGNSTFSGCTATGNGDGGMLATGTGDFSACVSTNNETGYGLYCGSVGSFIGCTSGSNGSTGISAGSGISTVDGCDVNNNGGAGVSIGGSGTFNGLDITGNGGTGLSAGSGSTFTDCDLSNNAGSGISVGSGTSTFTDITVSNSSAGRGIYNMGTGEFVNVTVSGSSSDGIYTGASTSLNNCSSSSNGGYGIWVDNSGFLTNCLADGNDKGIYVGAYSSEIINCLATNNTTYGMELLNSSTLIQNCAISGNGTGVFAGGTSGPAFMNVIIYDNTSELDGESGSTYTIDYSDIKGGETFGAWATGSGNIDADPLFADSDDYSLQEGSPCIDTGNPGVQYNDTDGSRNDMGAFGGPNGDW